MCGSQQAKVRKMPEFLSSFSESYPNLQQSTWKQHTTISLRNSNKKNKNDFFKQFEHREAESMYFTMLSPNLGEADVETMYIERKTDNFVHWISLLILIESRKMRFKNTHAHSMYFWMLDWNQWKEFIENIHIEYRIHKNLLYTIFQ
jgi:hypothetical protein